MKEKTDYQGLMPSAHTSQPCISACNASSINKEIEDTKFGIFRM